VANKKSDVISIRSKVISCFGNINSVRNIAMLCGCSEPYVINIKSEYEDFCDKKVKMKPKYNSGIKVKSINPLYYRVFSVI